MLKDLIQPPYLHAALLVFLIAIFLIFQIRKKLIEEEKNTLIDILNISDGQEVGYEQDVYVSVRPFYTPIQVLVFSGDDKWYPQRKIRADGSSLSSKCYFGGKNSTGQFWIVAISGERVKKPRAKLPEGVAKSNRIRVVRK